MHRGSTPQWGAVLLVIHLLMLSSAKAGVGHPLRDPPTRECEQEDPAACVFGAVFAVILAPFTYPFSGLRTSYRPADPEGMGLRFDRAFRSLGAPQDRTHPFVGVGWQASVHHRNGTFVSPPHVEVDNAFEVSLGYQVALEPLLDTPTASAIWTTEGQGLLGSPDASVRARTGPGISFGLGGERRLRLHLTLAVNLAGPHRGRVHPGFGIGSSWK